MQNKETESENGMLSVEAVLSLVPFICVILGIISFINIFMIHNKIQYAMYVAANELTGYTYFYQVSGLRDADRTFNQDRKKAEKPVRDEIDNVVNFMSKMNSIKSDFNSAQSDLGDLNIDGVTSSLQSAYDNSQGALAEGKNVIAGGKELLKDPKKLVAAFVYYMVGEGENNIKSWLLGSVSAAMIEENLDITSYANRSLINHPLNADQFLKAYGVNEGMDGLDFSACKLFEDGEQRMIDIVVQYDIEVYFYKLFLKDPNIHVIQRVCVPAWLGGDDEKGYYNTQ